ncbi:MAG: hypothetical protein WEB57_10385 [Pseudohongiellaceae bacterium]
MNRSRQATNAHCYCADGTWKPCSSITVWSTGYRRLQQQLAEAERLLAATRKRSHGNTVNRILALGNQPQSDSLSYRALQKCFGRSVKVRATGALIEQLRRKSESAGGALIDLDNRSLKLSQYDHFTDACTKKSLSERWHRLGDRSGVVQRDLYSAFLARVVHDNTLHPSRAVKAWPAAQSLLGRAGWVRDQPVSVATVLATTTGLPAPIKRRRMPSSEPVARQRTFALSDTSEVVGRCQEPKGVQGDGPRTPAFRRGETQPNFRHSYPKG